MCIYSVIFWAVSVTVSSSWSRTFSTTTEFQQFLTSSSNARSPHSPYSQWPGRDRMLASITGIPFSASTSYETIRQQFQMPRPTYYNIGVDCMDKHGVNGNRTALIYSEEDGTVVNVTYAQGIELSNRMANGLKHACNLQKGDRVAILMSQSIETALAHVAVYKSGGIAVPLFILFGPEALEYRLNDSGATIAFVEVKKSEHNKKITLNSTQHSLSLLRFDFI